jgi:hypothetical protein
VYVALGGEEAVVACAHFGEGIRDEIGFWKIISVAEDVGERVRSMVNKRGALRKA